MDGQPLRKLHGEYGQCHISQQIDSGADDRQHNHTRHVQIRGGKIDQKFMDHHRTDSDCSDAAAQQNQSAQLSPVGPDQLPEPSELVRADELGEKFRKFLQFVFSNL